MKQRLFLIVMAAIMFVSCSKKDSTVTEPEITQEFATKSGTSFYYDFTLQEDWNGGFADCPVDNDFYNLLFSWKNAPGKLKATFGKTLYITGDNHSDDLFMFVKKQITGLTPNATYQLNYNFDIINDVPEGLIGIGGSPGESVYMKFGAVNYEPLAILDPTETFWMMNIDKGNQSLSGTDMLTIGNVANPNVDIYTPKYAPKHFDSYEIGFDFQVTADENGSVWVIIGTDSGFEGTTEVYYDNVTVIFDQVL